MQPQAVKSASARKSKEKEEAAAPAKPVMLTAADLAAKVCVTLQETETIWLLELPGTCANTETEEGKAVEQLNAK